MKKKTKIFRVEPIRELSGENLRNIRGGVGAEDPPPHPVPNPGTNPNTNNPDSNNKRGIRITHIG